MKIYKENPKQRTLTELQRDLQTSTNPSKRDENDIPSILELVNFMQSFKDTLTLEECLHLNRLRSLPQKVLSELHTLEYQTLKLRQDVQQFLAKSSETFTKGEITLTFPEKETYPNITATTELQI